MARDLLGDSAQAAVSKSKSGDCLNWPERNPDAAEVVDCKDEHRFEVAESVDMRTFPGSEYGPDAAPPSPSRIQQISQEQCQVAVRRYLGERFDPNSRFTVSMMWAGDKAWRQSGERRMLCGLQLPGVNNSQLAFQGKVADIDQSKVWPAGTCLGIDPSTNQPTDIPVDCAGPHAMEVTGAVNLAEKFPAGLPPEPEQDAFIKDACTRMTDAYLAPIQLRSTTLTLIYSTISLPSWSAGSHQVSCSIGATLGNGGWSTLLNSAKGSAADQRPAPDPAAGHPRGAAELPADPDARHVVVGRPEQQRLRPDGSSQSSQSTQQTQSNQHGQQSQGTASQTPATSATQAPPADGNTFLNGPPPARGPPHRRRLGHRLRRSGPRRRRRPAPPPAPAPAPAAGPARRAAAGRTARSRHRLGCSPVAVRMSPQRFEELVSDALDLIPPDLAAALDNVVVLVEGRNPEEPDLLGLYRASR